MILQELRSYIEQRGSVTRLQLAKQFKMSEDGVDAMLSVWLKRALFRELLILIRMVML